VDALNDDTIAVTLAPGEDDANNNFVEELLASIGDFVFRDDNANGLQDIDEVGIENVVVELLDTNQVVLNTTLTDLDGAYLFDDLAPGTYKVRFQAPEGFVTSSKNILGTPGDDTPNDSDADETTGESDDIVLIGGEAERDIDAGYYQTASLGNFVWLDENADGIQDPSEDGINDVTVNLYSADDTTTPIATTVTAMDDEFGDGFYEFLDLDPGDYVVGFADVDGFRRTPSNIGGNDAVDSDADETTGLSDIVTLDPNENDPTIDAGYFATASIGNITWIDENGNGLIDADEPALPGVMVTLLDENMDPVNDADGNLVADATTDEFGEYSFDNLVPGEYMVMFVEPDGYIATQVDVTGANTDATDIDTDSDANPENDYKSHVVTLTSGETDDRLDAGFFIPAAIGDYVFNDEDGDGLQDPTETGIDGITVNLYVDSNMDNIPDGPAIRTTETFTNLLTGSGFYLFDSLPAGKYIVEFVAPGLLASPQDAVVDDLDSDADPFTGLTPFTELTPGERDSTIDAGFYQPAQIGNFVWEDAATANSVPNLQDPEDMGFGGVTVRLYAGNNPDAIDETTTDGFGAYLFTGLPAGDYRVEFVLPPSYEFTSSTSDIS